MNKPSAEKVIQDCTWSVLADLKLQILKQGVKDIEYHFWYDEGTREGENEIVVMNNLVSGNCIKIFGDGKPYFEIYNISDDEDQNKNGFLFYRLEIRDNFFKLYDKYAEIYAINEGLINKGNINLKSMIDQVIITLGLKRKQKILVKSFSNGKPQKTSELITKTDTKKLTSLIRDVNKKIIKHNLEIKCIKKKTTNKQESVYQLISH